MDPGQDLGGLHPRRPLPRHPRRGRRRPPRTPGHHHRRRHRHAAGRHRHPPVRPRLPRPVHLHRHHPAPGRHHRHRHPRRRRQRPRPQGLPPARPERDHRDHRPGRLRQHGGRGVSTAPRTHAQAQEWARTGTDLFLGAVAALDDDAFHRPSALPGWTRAHLVAHLAANADALCNLTHWAATGERTPMYASAGERAEGIAKGDTLTPGELRTWLQESARRLERSLDALTGDQWRTEVLTAQGRTVPATELPWMRAREVCVHAVDLATQTVAFTDLPDGFLTALVHDIRTRRGLTDLPDGPLPEVTAWLAGRPHTLADAPALGPWL
ncbi:maleylpyruvate isomerase family mycothiol-dependent enzyme [Streptomyces sp. SID8352]|nr:maleylpyruvate isomerase family mycothiol-dependent enzyme [Streptomyces sp. SID8352]